jgi:uncharacterized protein (TIGR02271 family)
MTTTDEHPLVIGVFRDHARAAQAIDELHRAGFHDNKIRLGQDATASGLLDSLDPPINQLRELEAEKTLPDELMEKGMAENEALYYQREFEAGHSIVIVESHKHQQEARAILQRYGAYDANSYVEQMEYDHTIPIREEVLQPHKQWVKVGEVILRKEVVTEEKTITVPIMREKLVIQRRSTSPQPSDQPVQEDETPEEILKDGETLRIVLHEEQVRIEKYSVETEEVFISKRQIEKTRHFSDTLKREEVHIERVGKARIRENDEDSVSEQ